MAIVLAVPDAEAVADRMREEIPYTLTNAAEIMFAVAEAVPGISGVDASRVAIYLDSIGYVRSPF